MKNKKYIKPTLEIIKLKSEDIIQTSPAASSVMPKASIGSNTAVSVGETEYNKVFE